MLAVNNVSFGYAEEHVLEDITINFEDNFIHGIVGLNGSGKTIFELKSEQALMNQCQYQSFTLLL